MSEFGYIYLTTNLVNNKKYIGQHISNKYDNYYYGSGILLSKAIKKYGRKNFKVEIIEWCGNLENLNECEKRYIKINNAVNSNLYYNLEYGGNCIGKHSVSSKNKMSRALKGKRKTIEHKLKLSEAHKGKVLSGEHKKAIGDGNKGKTLSDEHKKAIRNANLNKKFSKKHRERLSIAHKGKKLSDECKLKMGEARKGSKNGMYGRKHTAESIEKMKQPKPTIQCPYCNKIGSVGNMKRWHFDNCKFKIKRNDE